MSLPVDKNEKLSENAESIPLRHNDDISLNVEKAKPEINHGRSFLRLLSKHSHLVF